MGIERYSDRESWLAARRTCIGSSDLASLLNANPWGGKLSVYNSKVNGESKEVTKAMLAGIAHERGVAEMWAQGREERDLIEPEAPYVLYRHPELPFVGVTPDYLGLEDQEIVGLECKYPDPMNERAWVEGNQQRFMGEIQSQACLWVVRQCKVDVQRWYLAAGFGGTNQHEWSFEPDVELWNVFEREATKFWTMHVAKSIPPDPDPTRDSLDEIKARWPAPVEGRQLEIARTLAIKWRDLKARVLTAGEAFETVDKELKAKAQDAEVVTCDGMPIFSYKKNKDSLQEARPARTVPGARVLRTLKALETL